MDRSFQRSLVYSTLLHAALLAALFFLYHTFMVVRTPLLMDLTLIGQMSQGNGMGAPSSHAGETAGRLPAAESGGEFSTPRQETANPPLPVQPKPEVALRKPLKSKPHPGRAASEAYLRSLRNSAPIGLSPEKDVTGEIKATAGLGSAGAAGTPDGSPNIEGELAARAIKHQVNPPYPDWAKKQGIEAVVRFRITVLPNGLLREGDIQLEQTSGYQDLDHAVYACLIQWEFEPLAPQIPQADQSGVITFAFNLTNR